MAEVLETLAVLETSEVVETPVVLETPEACQQSPPLRALMLDTVITMIEAKFKHHERTPDSHQMQQIVAMMYQACCPDRIRVNPENLLYEESIVKEILDRIQF